MTEQNLDTADFSAEPDSGGEATQDTNDLDSFQFGTEPDSQEDNPSGGDEATDLSEGEPSQREKDQQEQETGKPWWKEVKVDGQVYELE